MDMMAGLRSKDSGEAYQLLLMLEEESAQSAGLYASFEDFMELLKDKSSLVRTRGFRLACAQARWDGEGKLERDLDTLLSELDDGKATAVRQCLTALRQVVFFRPELRSRIREKLDGMDLLNYKESMAPLLQKDIEELRKLMEGDRRE